MIGIIGGSGLTALAGLSITDQIQLQTPFGEPSAPLVKGDLGGKEILFLPRHGEHHTVPPHLINYRANLWAMHHLGVREIIAVAAVGGIAMNLTPGSLVLPTQLIDYSWGRESSFFSEDFSANKHIDFTYPYDTPLRHRLIDAAKAVNVPLTDGGTYAVTQGPRLETAAEITRLRQDGADIVGMTAMPEAVLARELNVAYVTLAVVANTAAGLSDEVLSMQAISQTVEFAMDDVLLLLGTVLTHSGKE